MGTAAGGSIPGFVEGAGERHAVGRTLPAPPRGRLPCNGTLARTAPNRESRAVLKPRQFVYRSEGREDPDRLPEGTARD
jgi:hypothetical protein